MIVDTLISSAMNLWVYISAATLQFLRLPTTNKFFLPYPDLSTEHRVTLSTCQLRFYTPLPPKAKQNYTDLVLISLQKEYFIAFSKKQM